MIQRHPNVGYVFCSTQWAKDAAEAKIEFNLKNKDYMRPFDKIEAWPCDGCEECSGKRS